MQYEYPGTRILKNKLNIQNEQKLQITERMLTTARISEIKNKKITGKFDAKHLASIHQYIFQDIYEWAGQFRTIDISKNGYQFIEPKLIKPCLNEVHKRLKTIKYLKNASKDETVNVLTITLSNLNKIHPFREGNSRTQRIFLYQLAQCNNYELDLSKITQDETNKASFHANIGNPNLLRYLINQNLKKTPQETTQTLSESEKIIQKAFEEIEANAKNKQSEYQKY